MTNLTDQLYMLLTYLNVPAKLDAILANQASNQEKIMSVLSDLQASVAAEDATVDKAVALLQGLSAALAAAGTDPVALAALKADIDAKTAGLAAEIAKDTLPSP